MIHYHDHHSDKSQGINDKYSYTFVSMVNNFHNMELIFRIFFNRFNFLNPWFKLNIGKFQLYSEVWELKVGKVLVPILNQLPLKIDRRADESMITIDRQKMQVIRIRHRINSLSPRSGFMIICLISQRLPMVMIMMMTRWLNSKLINRLIHC